jgi:hypothetical protein
MKALVLSYDHYRPIAEHMLATYSRLWPANPFTFVIPYQSNSIINTHGQRVEMVQSTRDVMGTVDSLLRNVAADEWVYWCVDDKFVLDVDAEAATYFTHYVQQLVSDAVSGLCFCRARSLLVAPHVSDRPALSTPRGDALLRRFNFNQIWLHQLLRGRVLSHLFSNFPRHDFVSTDLDLFTRQGPNALSIPDHEVMYVTENNFMVLGESTTEKKVTRTCVDSMRKWGLNYPAEFGFDDNEIVIGSMGSWQGE